MDSTAWYGGSLEVYVRILRAGLHGTQAELTFDFLDEYERVRPAYDNIGGAVCDCGGCCVTERR